MALQSHSFEQRFFLNRDTGAIAFYSYGQLSDFDIDEDADPEDVLESGNYFEILAIPSSDAFRVMEAFIETLPPGIEQIRLSDAISGGKPFRRFKDILLNYPDIRESWFKFEMNAWFDIASEWLRDNNIDATLVKPARLLQGL